VTIFAGSLYLRTKEVDKQSTTELLCFPQSTPFARLQTSREPGQSDPGLLWVVRALVVVALEAIPDGRKAACC